MNRTVNRTRRGSAVRTPELVVVWGNCQAPPLAELLRGPMAEAGLTVVDSPPVFLASDHDIDQAHRSVREAALLISQPISETYRFGGCGTAALAAELPESGRLITIPTAFHEGPFPYLVNAHGADGARVAAPMTDYHDLRAVAAAHRRLSLEQAQAWWPDPSSDTVRTTSTLSLERLRRREAGLDIAASDLLAAPDSLWAMNHPSNRVLADIARRILELVGIDDAPDVPVREFLAERVAPVEPAVAAALGWPVTAARPRWTVAGSELDPLDVLGAHLDFYATRPDVVADTVRRYAARIPSDQSSASARRSAPVSSA